MDEEDKARKDAEEKEAKEREDRMKADAAKEGEQLDKILSGIDSLTKRMDKLEEGRKDRHERRGDGEGVPREGEPEKVAADKHGRKDGEESEEEKKAREDKARKDSEEKEAKEAKEREDKEKARKDAEEKEAKEKEEREREDKARADSLDGISKRIADVEAKIKPLSETDRAALTDAQARADMAYQAFGDAAPRALPGEELGAYRRRLVTKLKEHSPDWKGTDLFAIADDATFAVIEGKILADAVQAARNPTDLQPGQLRMIPRSQGGHEIHEFAGEPRAWMDPIAGATRQFVTAINTAN